MAFYDDFAAAPGLLGRARRVIEGLLETEFDRRSRRLSQRVAALRGMSDDDLARLGLTRDQIIPYVFGTPRTRR